jgi:hypothetical protein
MTGIAGMTGTIGMVKLLACCMLNQKEQGYYSRSGHPAMIH